jgi:hypothetical protein
MACKKSLKLSRLPRASEWRGVECARGNRLDIATLAEEIFDTTIVVGGGCVIEGCMTVVIDMEKVRTGCMQDLK